DMLDFLTTSVLMPLGMLCVLLFLGWYIKVENLRKMDALSAKYAFFRVAMDTTHCRARHNFSHFYLTAFFCIESRLWRAHKSLLSLFLPQEIHTIASLHTEQIANIDSADMSAEIWLTLAKRVDTLLQSAHIRFCKII
ncbi:asparaginase domain-containing protein, partial [Helicobacter typhlonius]|uniref:asparaginase domain-containing protein n=3 Tax=Helicobacter typhlonius TaxID=76936 RepID=UPI002FDF7ACE